jgi:predicted membrane metal-binding protein
LTLTVIFSGASLVLCGFFFIYFTFYIKRRTDRANILADYQDEVNKLIADIDSATDRDLTLVENRITALKKLLEDVDKRIAVLSREQDRKQNSNAVYTSLGRQIKVTVREPEGPVLVDKSSPAQAASVSRGSPPEKEPAVTVAGNTLDVVNTIGGGTSPGPEPKESSFAERVTELFRAGFAPDLIAARLGVSLSEVELAIAVSRPRQSPDGET